MIRTTAERNVVSLFVNDVEMHLTFQDVKTWGALKSKERLEAPWLRWESMKYTANGNKRRRRSTLPFLDASYAGKRTIPALYFHHWLHPRCITAPRYIRAYIYGIEGVSNGANLSELNKNNNSTRIEFIFPKKAIFFIG